MAAEQMTGKSSHQGGPLLGWTKQDMPEYGRGRFENGQEVQDGCI